MNCKSNQYVNLATLILAGIIFIQMNVIIIMLFTMKNVENKDIKETYIPHIETKKWKIEIPKIDLEANIQEGTEQSIINVAIGHFKETQYIDGNIGLVAGCQGYEKNYFAKLGELEQGDKIFYQYGEEERQYKVIFNDIIDQKDWSYLKNTQENKLTLITGIPNDQEKRRCVQAVKI